MTNKIYLGQAFNILYQTIVFKINWPKILKIKFNVCMINDFHNSHEEIDIAKNEKGAKDYMQIFIPNSIFLEAKWVYNFIDK